MSQPAPLETAAAVQSPPSSEEFGVRRPVAAALIIAGVVVAVLVIGLALRVDADRLPSGPPLPPPSPTAARVQIDHAGRKATYGNVSVTLAGEPYACPDRPSAMGPLAEAVDCSFVVHRRYSGSRSWQAQTGFALVPDELAVDGDPEATARAVFQKLLEQGYPPDVKVGELAVDPYTQLGEAAILSARVNLRIPKLSTRFDAVVLVVVTARDGRQVLFYSVKPDDAGASALKALQTSANTLTRTV